MSNNPRVSVCIPSFNHARYLPAAIESVLSQTYRDFEIVIVDDGSTDGSLEIAQAYAKRFSSQIRVFTHPGGNNCGISETVNLAYQKSRGEFWSGLPSDDMLYPDKLERQVNFLDAHSEIGWVYSYGKFVDEAGQPLASDKLFGKDVTRTPNPLIHLIQANAIPGMTALMRRSCTEAVGLHQPSLIYSDWEFWLRMAMHCKVAFMPFPTVMCRLHTYNTSGNVDAHENMRRGLDVMISFRDKVSELNHQLLDARTRALLELQLAYHFFCLGNANEARRSLDSAFAIDRTLAADATFFALWLRDRIFELQHTFGKGSPESGFARWLQENLQSLALTSLSRRAEAAQFAKFAFESYDADSRTSWRMAVKCLRKDVSWIQNRSLRTIFLKGFFRPILGH